ncbi:MAG: putative rane-bound dehydrogenase domain protein [Pedosphaera sp.]|nr:putative rane-bound dehydrogenase domain protein [Pedosphaera sp.]
MNYLFGAMERAMKAALFILICLPAAFAQPRNVPGDPFSDIIRQTEPLTPEQERQAFHLPPGFEIELVAAEPQIGKPINMQFDSQGRLWITQSREYPFPAPLDKPARDAIKILSDFDAQGHAGKITTFADGLNIPIGIYPYDDGAIGYSIPYIYRFHDTNHDGQADFKEPLLGRFGFEKDTHGMTSSFRRGFDGWMYANHGYHNDSVLTAKDGSSITMHSGNTYRVKVDGSRVEQWAWGRVNPFGLIFDPLGNLYSSDCETLPIYQILRGGYYPSFGKPDDGLGFAPPMMSHKHGSTAIAGIVYYAATNFPPSFHSNIFVGNVMTCRIDRDSLEEHGSTWLAHEQPDFLVSDDPWFRPVDIQMGPDGAIYVADFYNRIIGHYEVPLDHPGRDRERGRIWRITYHDTNAPAKIPSPQDFDLSHDSADALVQQLGNDNLTIRMLAMSELTDRIGQSAAKPVAKMMRSPTANVWQKIHGLWVLHRLGALDSKTLDDAAHAHDRALRVHAMRVLSELPTLSESQHALLLSALYDPDALVERCAADALGRHPQFENIRPLLDARYWAPTNDTHLVHVIRMALRDHLLVSSNFAQLPLAQWGELEERAVTDVALGVPTAESANFLLRHLQSHAESRAVSANDLRHIARYLPESQIGDLVDFTRKQFKDDVDFQFTLFQSVQEGMAQRGDQPGASLREWGMEIATRLASSTSDEAQPWHNTPLNGKQATANPWTLQVRASADGEKTARFISSMPAGEKLTGILRSQTFVSPAKLSFWMAGHNGRPDKPDLKKNVVRLVAADSGKVLQQSFPPRNDVAQKFEWDLGELAAQQQKVYLEIEDGDNATAFAWLAMGRLEPEVVPWPVSDPRLVEDRKVSVAKIAREFKVAALEPRLAEWLAGRETDEAVREAAALGLIAINPEAHISLISMVSSNVDEDAALREKMAQALAAANLPAARAALIESLRVAPDRLQVKMALALAGSDEGAETLLQLAESGKISPRLLLNRPIQERLTAAKPAHYQERAEKLTKGLSPANEELQKILDARRVKFDPAKASAVLGAKTFAQNCMVCHSMDNQGGAVGPHLDGVGNRGLERLIEDILDPSRNVDPSFRYSIVTLKNGDVLAGLQRREEGAVIVFVDATGKEIPVAKTDIERRVESTASLMPDNFSEAIPIADFNNLLAFLLSKSNVQAAKK